MIGRIVAILIGTAEMTMMIAVIRMMTPLILIGMTGTCIIGHYAWISLVLMVTT